MAKRTKNPAMNITQEKFVMIKTLVLLVQENRNLLYIAIIGICLSITILFKIGQYAGWWSS